MSIQIVILYSWRISKQDNIEIYPSSLSAKNNKEICVVNAINNNSIPIHHQKNNSISPKLQSSRKVSPDNIHNNLNKERRHSHIETQLQKFPLALAGKIIMPPTKLNYSETEDNMEQSLPQTSILNEVNLFYIKNSCEDKMLTNSVNYLSADDNQDFNMIKEPSNYKISQVVLELNRLNDINFNVFNLYDNSEGLELLILMSHISRLYNFEYKLNINNEEYRNYFFLINTHYKKNPYP